MVTDIFYVVAVDLIAHAALNSLVFCLRPCGGSLVRAIPVGRMISSNACMGLNVVR